MESRWLILGLGNPGEDYDRTRHNAGSRAAERLAVELGLKLRPTKAPALVADYVSEGVGLIVARPTTYVNESGRAVALLSRWFGIEPETLIVLHDEIDLEVGTIRLKKGGGTAGHHGLDSIVEAIGTPDFYRVRIGVGRPPSVMDGAEWVLKRMTKKEAEGLRVSEAEAADAALAIIHEGLERAMNRYNTRPE